MRAGSMPRGGRIVMRCMPFFILPFIMSFPSVSCNLAFFVCHLSLWVQTVVFAVFVMLSFCLE